VILPPLLLFLLPLLLLPLLLFHTVAYLPTSLRIIIHHHPVYQPHR
jgi:hypothetical protein